MPAIPRRHRDTQPSRKLRAPGPSGRATTMDRVRRVMEYRRKLEAPRRSA